MSVNLDKRIAAVTRWAPTTAEQRRAATEPMRTARDEQFWQAAVEALGPDADPSAVGEDGASAEDPSHASALPPQRSGPCRAQGGDARVAHPAAPRLPGRNLENGSR